VNTITQDVLKRSSSDLEGLWISASRRID